MFKRQIEAELRSSAKDYPVVTLIGPRQSGKTTLVRSVFENMPYVNLEAPDVRQRALSDPRGFLALYPDGVILDEIQAVPELLSYIQVIVDEIDQKGRYILTGSHQLKLHKHISQSLAGRTALLTLLPMSLLELERGGSSLQLDQQLLKGFYPRIYQDQLDPLRAYRNYLQTYIERDVRDLINIKNLTIFQRFIQLCTGRIGQLFNADSLSNEVGVSSHTIREWLSVLEASFIIVRLPPYYENLGKRLIKSPKIYFVDVGLACYLLGIENEVQLSRDPLRGQLFENMVVMELLKARHNQGLDPRLYFYRDLRGNEVDLIYQKGRDLVPIEIKASQTYHKSFLTNLSKLQSQAPDRVTSGFLVYGGKEGQGLGSNELISYRDCAKITD